MSFKVAFRLSEEVQDGIVPCAFASMEGVKIASVVCILDLQKESLYELKNAILKFDPQNRGRCMRMGPQKRGVLGFSKKRDIIDVYLSVFSFGRAGSEKRPIFAF